MKHKNNMDKINKPHNDNKSCQLCGHHMTQKDQKFSQTIIINNSLNKNMLYKKNKKIPLDGESNKNSNFELNLKQTYTHSNKLPNFEYFDNSYRNHPLNTYNLNEMIESSYVNDNNQTSFRQRKNNKKKQPMDSYIIDYNENNNITNSNISNINSITLSNFFNNDNSNFNFNNSKNFINRKNSDSDNSRKVDNCSNRNNINKSEKNNKNIKKHEDNGIINQFTRQNFIDCIPPQNIINIKNIYKENGNKDTINKNSLINYSNNQNDNCKNITIEKCEQFSVFNKCVHQLDISIVNSKKNLYLKSLLQIQTVINDNILNSSKKNSTNNNNIPLNISNNTFIILPMKKKSISKIELNNPLIKNQFMNHNINIHNMLTQIDFFQRLSKITKERVAIFKKKYQKDNFFMDTEEFDNIFINESDIGSNSPLTLIFHYIFNPSVSHTPRDKNFFESIFLQRGDQMIGINYSEKDLKNVPKYFNDFNYVNNLFYRPNNPNNFNNFLDEILLEWKNTFSFELEFRHPLIQFNIGCNIITIRDVPKIYFISPTDLIVDYHSYASNFPLSDVFVSISQYRFHCDIKFNIKKGKFEFKTSLKVYNTIKLVKECILQKTIKNEADITNKKELQIHTWKPMKNTIENANKINMDAANEIFNNYLREELVKYSTESPSENDLNLYYNEIEGNDQNDSNLKQIDINTMKNNNNDFIHDFPFVTEKENNKLSKEENKKNTEKLMKKINRNSEIKKNSNEAILKRAIIFILLLFIFKAGIALYNGGLCFETYFNSIICILIWFFVYKFTVKI